MATSLHAQVSSLSHLQAYIENHGKIGPEAIKHLGALPAISLQEALECAKVAKNLLTADGPAMSLGPEASSQHSNSSCHIDDDGSALAAKRSRYQALAASRETLLGRIYASRDAQASKKDAAPKLSPKSEAKPAAKLAAAPALPESAAEKLFLMAWAEEAAPKAAAPKGLKTPDSKRKTKARATKAAPKAAADAAALNNAASKPKTMAQAKAVALKAEQIARVGNMFYDSRLESPDAPVSPHGRKSRQSKFARDSLGRSSQAATISKRRRLSATVRRIAAQPAEGEHILLAKMLAGAPPMGLVALANLVMPRILEFRATQARMASPGAAGGA